MENQEELTTEVSTGIAGRLSIFFENWTKITRNKVILSWVKGFKIPFSEPPVQDKKPKVFIAEKELNLYSCAITILEKKGAIEQCSHIENEFLSSYFLVPKVDGGVRFILNLKKLNEYINAPHFKLEDYRSVLKLISKNDFMAKIDLEDAYFAVPIDINFKKFLRFQFNNKLYEFKVLPFGLNIAPFVFTKILKPLLHYLRSKGLVSVVYLDDMLLLGSSYRLCKENIHQTTQLLTSLGFTINFGKSILIPSHEITFLGFTFNSKELTFSAPLNKKQKILEEIHRFILKKDCKIKEFAALIGQLVAVCPAVKYGWLYIKFFEREKWLALLSVNNNYNKKMLIPEYLSKDFLWWSSHLGASQQQIKEDPFVKEIFTDASLKGWGAYCNGEKTHGFWNPSQQDSHINYLELIAAFYGLKSFSKKMRNCSILLRIDNTTAISCINRMGSVQYEHFNSICREIWQWCEERNIRIFASYISSEENIIADLESRSLQIDTEYSLNNKYIHKIFSSFGYPEIDLFACELNTKCKRYVSWKPDPGSETVDAFTLNWSNVKFYAFPPFSIISRVLDKIICDKAEGIVVVPEWPNQPWYPKFNKMLLKSKIILGPNKNLILSPSSSPHPNYKHLTLAAGILSGKPF